MLETRSQYSICFIFVLNIYECREIDEFSKVIFTNLNASIRSGFLVFENCVFLFTYVKVSLIAFKFVIHE